MTGSAKKYSDIKGSRDRGPKEFKSHVVSKQGDIMAVAERNVITVPPTTTIKKVASLMKENDFRRFPIVDPGTKRLMAWRVPSTYSTSSAAEKNTT